MLGDCQERADILTAIRKCDLPLLQELVNNAAFTDEVKNDLLACAHFIGNAKELESLKLSAAGKKALEPLLHLVSSLEKAGYADYMTIDLSELSDLDYYNGIIFNTNQITVFCGGIAGGEQIKETAHRRNGEIGPAVSQNGLGRNLLSSPLIDTGTTVEVEEYHF